MADLSFFPGGKDNSGGGGSGGTTDYNELRNRPVTNINGKGVVVSSLSTGVYNIKGTWKMTEDDTERDTLDDDLFYVLQSDDGTKLTRISAGEIKTFRVPAGGSATDVVVDEMATAGGISTQLVGEF